MPAILALAGCTGQNFVRFEPSAFKLGQTKRAEVYARVGPHPNSFDSLQVQGKKVWTMTYSYKNNFSKGLRPEITPTKAETYYFLDDVLVGMDYTDSFKGEGTDFDQKKITSIKKGVSTKTDVIQLFGPAKGRYAPPLIPDTSYRALVYFSKQISGSRLLSEKKLIVTYDRNGIVTDVKYTASGNP